jgi:3-isopropylmalate/(R)-2-methylmalate dehydratase small subunit
MVQSGDILRGAVYVLGDNIDTDLIIPAQYLNLVPTIPEEYRKLGSYALAGLPDAMPRFVEPGAEKTRYAIVVAGANFGCGSSREHAPIALGAAGVQAVIAQSYARIFFRNAVATGEVYPLETPVPIQGRFRTGQDTQIDLARGEVINMSTGERFALSPLGAAGPVIRAGGLFAYARATGMIRQRTSAS